MNHIKTLLTTTLLLTSSSIWGADQLAATAAGDDTPPQHTAVSTVAEPSTLNLETQPIDELVRLANEGSETAQYIVAQGYATGAKSTNTESAGVATAASDE
jgi:hypothetical protein